jgi:pimeloyl-ACP methyl ester carboxylesterase
MRAHRAFRQLALLLTKAGFHVFRFDYFGTGDSAGDSTEGTIEQWVTDVGTAIDELKDTAGVSRVSVIGLRLGATLGMMAAATRPDVDCVVLWDPVVAGSDYTAALIEEGTSHESYRGARAPVREDGAVGVLGFPLTTSVRKALDSIDITGIPLGARIRSLVMVSEDLADYRLLERSLLGGGANVVHRCIPMDGVWNEVDNNGSALIPQALIQGIVGYLAAESR